MRARVGGVGLLLLGVIAGGCAAPWRLSSDWQRTIAAPLIQDTVRVLLGGTLPVFRQHPRPLDRPDTEIASTTHHRGRAADTLTFYELRAHPHALLHELGHVLDARNLAWQECMAVTTTRARPGTYAATSDDEHIAEAFARAVESMRGGYADSLAANRDVPGALVFVRWLRQQWGQALVRRQSLPAPP